MEIQSPITSVKLGEYEFCLGDTIVTTDGIVGKITGFCNCDECRKRGFLEPFWEDEESDQFITIHSVKNGLRGFHRIGKNLLHPFDKDWIESKIEKLNDEICKLRWQLATINVIEAEEAHIDTEETFECLSADF